MKRNIFLAVLLLSHFNIFAIKKSDAAMLYEATLKDCLDKTQEYLQQLIGTGIDINSEENVDEALKGFTALHMASYYGFQEGIPLLLAVGANIDKPVGPLNKKFFGMTALQLAIIRNLPLVARMLLQNHASIDLASPEPFFSTSLCFDRLVRKACSNFSKEPESEYKVQLIKIAREKIIYMARVLIEFGFKFDEYTKIYTLHALNIKL